MSSSRRRPSPPRRQPPAPTYSRSQDQWLLGGQAGHEQRLTCHVQRIRGSRLHLVHQILPHGGDRPWWRRPPPYSESAAAEFGRAMDSSAPGFLRFIKRKALERSGYLVDDCFAVRCDIHVVSTSAAVDAVVEDDDLHRLGLPCRRSCNGDDVKRCAAVARSQRRHRWLMAAWFRLFRCCK